MTGLFDNISHKLEAEAGQRGISAWEITRLSPSLRAVVRALLREVELTYPDLRRLLQTESAGEVQLTPAELDKALQQLLNQAWIVRMGQQDTTTYRINLQPRRGTRLSPSLWQQLEQRLSNLPAADD
ncbi:MAG TPA: hypothetical protein VK879_16085 [Candidatus Sulfomarinibacteraceae bacterium]|nr:hypothetical protein [Candidatus Sulfomarinibacteraceae bacterium]